MVRKHRKKIKKGFLCSTQRYHTSLYKTISQVLVTLRKIVPTLPLPSENRLMREIVRENLTKRQKCYIIMYYTKGMTMQEIADAEGVSKSTVSRTIGLARKRISCGMKPAMLKSALKGR